MGEPVLSVLTEAADPGALHRTYESLAAQTDRRWEWCLGLDADDSGRGVAGLPLDPRLVFTGAADDPADQLAATFRAATGRHVLRLAAGDLLTDDTVARIVDVFAPGQWGYTDEEQQFPSGRRDVWLK